MVCNTEVSEFFENCQLSSPAPINRRVRRRIGKVRRYPEPNCLLVLCCQALEVKGKRGVQSLFPLQVPKLELKHALGEGRK